MEVGNYRDIGRQSMNVLNAIEMRTNKQKHTEFFYKLDELKDRIEVYNELFRSNVPKFMKKKSLRVSYIYIKCLEISI